MMTEKKHDNELDELVRQAEIMDDGVAIPPPPAGMQASQTTPLSISSLDTEPEKPVVQVIERVVEKQVPAPSGGNGRGKLTGDDKIVAQVATAAATAAVRAAVKEGREPPVRDWKRPGSGYFRNYLKGLVPSAEQVKIYVRDEKGRVSYFGSYGERDLERTGDIEEFIQKYVSPHVAGATEFEIVLINEKGEEATRSAPFTVLNPQAATGGGSVQDNTLARVLDSMVARMERLETKLQEQATKPVVPPPPPPAPPSVQEKVAEFEAIKKLMGGDKMDPQMQILLMEKLSGKQRRPDDEVIAELRAELKELRRMAAAPPPVLPPPLPHEPPVNVAEIARTIAESMRPQQNTLADAIALVKTLQPEHKPKDMADVVKEFLPLLPVIKEIFGGGDKHDSVRQLAEEVRALKNQPSKGLKETIDDVRAIQGLIHASRPPMAQVGDESFLGVINNLVDKAPDTIRQITNLVHVMAEEKKAIRNGGTVKNPPINRKPKPQPQPAKPAQAAPQKPQDAPQAAQTEAAPAQPTQAAPQQPEADGEDDGVDVPDGYIEFTKKIEAAITAGEEMDVIMYVLQSFQWLAKQDDEWMKILLRLVNACKRYKEGKNPEQAKEFVIGFVDEFFEQAGENTTTAGESFMSADAAANVKPIFEAHIEQIIDFVASGGSDTSMLQAPEAPSAPAAPDTDL